MNYQHILYEVKDQVAWLTFNRPEQLNAMNSRMMQEIIDALKEIRTADPVDLRVAVITGAGKAFMAGADIKEYARQTQEQFEDFQTTGYSLYAAIEDNPKPVIAAINGYAFGGGFEIALACDMILAVEGTKMGLPEIALNLIPGGGGTMRLSKKIGSNLAREIIMTGRTVLAEEMYARGLINHLYPQDAFMGKVAELAARLASKFPDRLQVIKQISQLSLDGDASAEATRVQDIEREALNRFYQSAEGKEKIEEFYRRSLEKRK